MSITEVIMWLILAHFIADWGTGNSWIGANKGKYFMVMLAHCMMYTAVCTLTLKLLGLDMLILIDAWIILLSHICIDLWKSDRANPEKFPTWHLYVDQAAHIIILIILASLEFYIGNSLS